MSSSCTLWELQDGGGGARRARRAVTHKDGTERFRTEAAETGDCLGGNSPDHLVTISTVEGEPDVQGHVEYLDIIAAHGRPLEMDARCLCPSVTIKGARSSFFLDVVSVDRLFVLIYLSNQDVSAASWCTRVQSVCVGGVSKTPLGPVC